MRKFLIICISIINLWLCCMTGCKHNYKVGQFYTLEQAYNNGWISKTDISKVAYYHNNRKIIKLSEYNRKILEISYVKQFPRQGVYAEDVVIHEYLGEYNDCLMAIIGYGDDASTVVWTEFVAGVEINYTNGFRIYFLKL